MKLSRKQKEEIIIKQLNGEVFDYCPICGIICKTEGAYRFHVIKHDPLKLSKVYLERHVNLLKAILK